MSLPRIDVPTYELKLPSSGQEIIVRPFLVKEEKLLLIAAESGDPDEIVRTTKQVIKNCIVEGDVKIDNLPFFDVDYLFIALRAKSIGEAVEMQFTCNATKPDNTVCGHVFDAEVDIANVHVVKDPDIPTTINLDGNTSIKMKYPNYTVMKEINDQQSLMDNKINVMMSCVDQVVKGENVYSSKDYTKEEMRDFIEGLTETNFKKLEKFIDNFPFFYVSVEKKCPSCGYDHKIKYTEFQSFFY